MIMAFIKFMIIVRSAEMVCIWISSQLGFSLPKDFTIVYFIWLSSHHSTHIEEKAEELM